MLTGPLLAPSGNRSTCWDTPAPTWIGLVRFGGRRARETGNASNVVLGIGVRGSSHAGISGASSCTSGSSSGCSSTADAAGLRPGPFGSPRSGARALGAHAAAGDRPGTGRPGGCQQGYCREASPPREHYRGARQRSSAQSTRRQPSRPGGPILDGRRMIAPIDQCAPGHGGGDGSRPAAKDSPRAARWSPAGCRSPGPRRSRPRAADTSARRSRRSL